jgi:hypothetical protein
MKNRVTFFSIDENSYPTLCVNDACVQEMKVKRLCLGSPSEA